MSTSYERYKWEAKVSKVTADRMNNIENGIEEALNAVNDSAYGYGEKCLNMLDGTATAYKSAMRKYFRYFLTTPDNPDAAELTALCDEWYELTRPEWCGWTEFDQTDVSTASTGTKGGDNAALSCTPSTDTVEGQDDYAGLPLFACVDVNWTIDASTLRPVITAIDGITGNFVRTDPSVPVGVMQMSGWVFTKENAQTYIRGYSANRNINYSNVEPLPSAINPDGTVRSWVVHAKYLSHTVDGKMTSCSGLIPTAWVSHNTMHTLSAANGTGYSGQTTADDTFLKMMMYIKYGSLTMDGIIQGCCSMNYQYYAQVAETGVNRVILTTANAANLEVGMSVLVGYYDASASSPADRGTAKVYSVTGQEGALITKIESVTVDGTEYSAVYVDTDGTFDTAANGTATDGTTILSSFHWITGKTDGVLGNDGSPTSCTSGKYPAKLQGIEYMNGAYEVFADVILNMYADDDEDYYYEPYTVKATADQSTAITDSYKATGLVVGQDADTDQWGYIKKLGYADGVLFPIEMGGTSSTYTKDAFYRNHNVTGTREWLSRGNLNNGAGNAGLSCVNGNNGLSNANWNIAAR